jgi:hypothetical protein
MARPGEYAAVAPVAAVAPAVAVAPVAPAIALPAPYTTAQQGPAAVSVHQPAPVIQKQLHFGSTTYVSGYATDILKPAIPELPIAVPTVLRGSHAVNPAIVKTVREPFVVNEPVPVERKVPVPYDVPVVREQIVEVGYRNTSFRPYFAALNSSVFPANCNRLLLLFQVPVPVHVSKPYAVPHPVPVAGEPIVNVRRTAPIVQHTHTDIVNPAVAVAAAPLAVAAPAPLAVAAAPAGAIVA